MHITANWKVAMSMLVALCLIVSQLEPSAFARAPQSSPPAGVAATQDPAPPVAAPQDDNPAPTQTKAREGKRRLKWLLIGAVAVGGALAIVLLKNRKKTEPVVTFGGPTVGTPQ